MADTPYSTLLEEALEGWAGVRQGVISEVENLPEDRLDWQWAEGSRSVRELIEHILESGHLVRELVSPHGDFLRQPNIEFIHEHAADLPRGSDKATLLRLLKETHETLDEAIRDAGELRMLQHIRRFDGQFGTRLAWFNHLVAHEYYHGGQIALVARLLGHVPALTQLIEAASAE